MTSTAVAKTTPSAVAEYSEAFSRSQLDLMKATVAKGCTDDEFQLFIQLATKYGLDPFAKEIWAIKRNQGDAALILTSRDGYLKIAQRDPNFVGLQAGVVKKGDLFKFNPADGTVEHEFGTERGPIIGAWAIAHHRLRMPVVCFVDFAEYKGTSPIWSRYPSAMIQKVGEVFVLKRQFGINGLVTREELDAEEPETIQQAPNTPEGSNAPAKGPKATARQAPPPPPAPASPPAPAPYPPPKPENATIQAAVDKTTCKARMDRAKAACLEHGVPYPDGIRPLMEADEMIGHGSLAWASDAQVNRLVDELIPFKGEGLRAERQLEEEEAAGQGQPKVVDGVIVDENEA